MLRFLPFTVFLVWRALVGRRLCRLLRVCVPRTAGSNLRIPNVGLRILCSLMYTSWLSRVLFPIFATAPQDTATCIKLLNICALCPVLGFSVVVDCSDVPVSFGMPFHRLLWPSLVSRFLFPWPHLVRLPNSWTYLSAPLRLFRLSSINFSWASMVMFRPLPVQSSIGAVSRLVVFVRSVGAKSVTTV